MIYLQSRKKQRGASLMMAIFILVVLALLGVAMVRTIAVSTDVVAREVVSARALMVAESGTQRMLSEIFPPGTLSSVVGACNANITYSFSALAGCNAVVNCTFVQIDAKNYYTLRSVGRCGPSNEPAVRIVEVQAKDV